MKLLISLLAISACSSGIGLEPGTSEAALTTGACTPTQLVRTADVTYSSGSCQRYTMSPSPLLQQNYLIPSPTLGTIVSVRTGSNAAAWVCELAHPIGFTQSPYAPCWEGSVNNGFQRVRGPWQSAQHYYAGASATITAIVGYSLALNLGTLPGPPPCHTDTALYWHPIGVGPWNGDNGMDAYTGSNDPADGPGSAVTTTWPDGTSGSPCIANATPTGYAEIYYAAF